MYVWIIGTLQPPIALTKNTLEHFYIQAWICGVVQVNNLIVVFGGLPFLMALCKFRFRADHHALNYDEANPTFDDELGGLDESLLFDDSDFDLYYTDSE